MDETMGEDRFASGTRLSGGARTITDAEIAFLPALMGAMNPLFHDQTSPSAVRMGSRILYGPALLGIAIALTEHLLHDRVLGLMEITAVRFRRPVRPGDTITASLVIGDCRPRDGGKPGLVLSVTDEVTNQEGELVLSFGRTILISDGQ
jgi:acyl dehydratase